MKAYGTPIPTKTKLKRNTSEYGEPIERKVERIWENKEPITDGAPTIYTERAQGVIPEYDIRSDRFDRAIEMTDTITKNAYAKRKEDQEKRKKPPIPPGTTDELK